MDAETFGLFVESVRRFVDERLIPAEDRVEEDDAIPAEIVKEIREMGLFGLSVPESYGGLGCTMVEEAAIISELTRASVVYRSLIGTTVGMDLWNETQAELAKLRGAVRLVPGRRATWRSAARSAACSSATRSSASRSAPSSTGRWRRALSWCRIASSTATSIRTRKATVLPLPTPSKRPGRQ